MIVPPKNRLIHNNLSYSLDDAENLDDLSYYNGSNDHGLLRLKVFFFPNLDLSVRLCKAFSFHLWNKDSAWYDLDDLDDLDDHDDDNDEFENDIPNDSWKDPTYDDDGQWNQYIQLNYSN